MDLTARRVAARYAADRAIFNVALEVFNSLPNTLKWDVEEFLQGVVVGKAQYLEARADELYEFYEPARRALRSKYGAEVHLYRGEPTKKPAIVRRFLSWTPVQRLAARFAAQKGYEVVEADVKVSDVAAVLVSPHNSQYIEYLVKDRKHYHERGSPLPLVGGYMAVYEGPYTVPFDLEAFTAWADETVRRLKSSVESVGGKVLKLKVDRDDEFLGASVQLPPTVDVDAYDAAHIGQGITIENLQPYAR